MSVLSPSAQATTIQPEMPPARKPVTQTARPAKGVLIQTYTVAPPVRAPKPMTVEEKRLKVAQAGFAHVKDLAYKYPDPYGFTHDENLVDARLGDPIPVYPIVQQGRVDSMRQPVKSL